MVHKTFKQRIRKNDLKQRHKHSVEMRKKFRVSKRTHNKNDAVTQNGKSIDELLAQVHEGSTVAVNDELDPRALANMLIQRDAGNGKLVLKDKITEGDPAAIKPPTISDDDESIKRQLCDEIANEGVNKNHYKHRGGAYIFWDNLGVPFVVLKALKEMKFTHPTPVQEQVFPSLMDWSSTKGKGGGPSKDTVVAAETGSGKTLLFVLPMVKGIIDLMTQRGEQVERVIEEKVNKEEDVKDEDGYIRENDLNNKIEEKGKKNIFKDNKINNSRKRDREKENDTTKTFIVKENQKGLSIFHDRTSDVMYGLVISPTRELALQIKVCLEQLTKYTNIRVGCIVGGMAPLKQQRILNTHPHVLICSPGRLWELTQKNEGCYLGHSISRRLHCVILDEADRLLQAGKFEDLRNILERIHSEVLPTGLQDSELSKKDHYGLDNKVVENEKDQHMNQKNTQHENNSNDDTEESIEEGEWDEVTQTFIPRTKVKSLNKFYEPSNIKGLKDAPRPIPIPSPPAKNHRVVTIVTSATLSLQTNYIKRDLKSNKQVIKTSNANVMQQVLQQLNINTKQANIFNLVPEADVVEKVHETYLRCSEKSKELYLYYFLKTYKERVLIFVNAISMLRRLVKILEVLGLPSVGLHASMQQRQRLKCIERFKNGEKRIMVATDIASRGLDVDSLRYIVHYQVPRTTDAYIHRCGRTARCGGTGLSLMMIDATEHTAFGKLLGSLGRARHSMEIFSLDPIVVHQLNPHLTIALQIDTLQKEIAKSVAKDRWVNQMSEAVEIEADDMRMDEDAKLANQAKAKAMRILRKRLTAMQKQEGSHHGEKGAYRTSAKAIGEKEAGKKLKERADRQVYKGYKF